MSWIQIVDLIVNALPTLASLIKSLLSGDNSAATKQAAQDHIAELNTALQAFVGPEAVRMLPPDTGDALRQAAQNVLHSHLALLRVAVEHNAALRGSIDNMAAQAAENGPPQQT